MLCIVGQAVQEKKAKSDSIPPSSTSCIRQFNTGMWVHVKVAKL
jgi:hypothetical protein